MGGSVEEAHEYDGCHENGKPVMHKLLCSEAFANKAFKNNFGSIPSKFPGSYDVRARPVAIADT